MTLYQEIRAASKTMCDKTFAAAKHLDFDAIRIAKRMTLPLSGRTLFFDGETAQNAFLDFWFHEYRVNGKSLVESVDPVAAGLLPLEAEVLAAYRLAYTSFFETGAVRLRGHQVCLRDLLEPNRPEVWLTDVGFSRTLHQFRIKIVLFFRLVVVRGIAMTSGFTFGFLPERAPGILQAYRQKMKKAPAADLPEARFVFFFQKYRQFGEDQEYRDVT